MAVVTDKIATSDIQSGLNCVNCSVGYSEMQRDTATFREIPLLDNILSYSQCSTVDTVSVISQDRSLL